MYIKFYNTKTYKMNYSQAIQNYNNLSTNAKEAVQSYTASGTMTMNHRSASLYNGLIPISTVMNGETFYMVEILKDYNYNKTNENMVVYHNNMYVMIGTTDFIPADTLA